MQKNILLERTVQTLEGRNGTIQSLDRDFTLKLATPKEMGGTENQDTNPEELLAAGYSACFASSMEFILRSQEINYTSLRAIASVRLVADVEQGGFKFSITMRASVDGVNQETKQAIINQAYLFCPYSKALKSNVAIELIVE